LIFSFASCCQSRSARTQPPRRLSRLAGASNRLCSCKKRWKSSAWIPMVAIGGRGFRTKTEPVWSAPSCRRAILRCHRLALVCHRSTLTRHPFMKKSTSRNCGRGSNLASALISVRGERGNGSRFNGILMVSPVALVSAINLYACIFGVVKSFSSHYRHRPILHAGRMMHDSVYYSNRKHSRSFGHVRTKASILRRLSFLSSQFRAPVPHMPLLLSFNPAVYFVHAGM
jgi:hypothetical protein